MKRSLGAGLILASLLVGCSGGARRTPGKASPESLRNLFDQGRYAEAIKASSGKGPLDAKDSLLRGRCHERLGNVESALADYRASRSADPDRGESYFREARLLVSADRVDEALSAMHLAEMRLAGMSHRERFYARAMLGEVHLAAGDPGSAREHLLKAVDLGGSSPFRNSLAVAVAWYNLSQAQFELAAFRSARDSYDRYLHGKGRTAADISPEDRYTEMTLRLLTGDIRGAQKIAAELPDRLRRRAEALLVGDTLSVKDLVDASGSKEER